MSLNSYETALEKAFRVFNLQQKLFIPGQRILVAVSGGIDSMTLLHILLKFSNPIGVIHCNFQLRAGDSDEDEVFIRNLCTLKQIPFYCRHFNTMEYAEENKLSIQLAARDLRYRFFEEIRLQEKYDLIAVAHNSDDTIETFFINLMRGTGIQGLTGIKPKSGKVIRPLIFASRQEIELFAQEIKMLHRLDKSNLQNKYKRNQIRNELIPFIEKMAPAFRRTILDVMRNLSGTALIYQMLLKETSARLVKENEGIQEIDINDLKNEPYFEIYLPEILRTFGFSAEVIASILSNIDAESGKTYLSPSHRLVKDRKKLLITNRNSEPDEIFYIDKDTSSLEFPLLLKINNELIDSAFEIPKLPYIACIDAEKLNFPLVLRHWKNGDYFRPLGMQQMKKLSDFFINEKFSVLDKERVWLLVSDGKIVWICGHRLDDRFKLSESSTRLLRIEILE